MLRSHFSKKFKRKKIDFYISLVKKKEKKKIKIKMQELLTSEMILKIFSLFNIVSMLKGTARASTKFNVSALIGIKRDRVRKKRSSNYLLLRAIATCVTVLTTMTFIFYQRRRLLETTRTISPYSFWLTLIIYVTCTMNM